MATTAFLIKRNDLRPRFRVQLTETDPVTGVATPVDLTQATAAHFIMSGAAGVKVNDEMEFIDRVTGIVEYAWHVGDTDTSGNYKVEVEVIWGTEPQTYPSAGFFAVRINDDLD